MIVGQMLLSTGEKNSTDLAFLVSTLTGLTNEDVTYLHGLDHTAVPGDWGVNSTSSVEDRLAGIQAQLETLGTLLAFTAHEGMERVIVVRGSPDFRRLPDVTGKPRVYLYTGGVGGRRSDFSLGLHSVLDLAGFLERNLHLQVISECSAEEELRFPSLYFMESAEVQPNAPSKRIGAILDNLSAQTGLEFEIELRNVSNWTVDYRQEK